MDKIMALCRIWKQEIKKNACNVVNGSKGH